MDIDGFGLKLMVKWVSEDKVEIRGGTNGGWDQDLRIIHMDEQNEFFVAYHYAPLHYDLNPRGKCGYAYCGNSLQFLGDQFIWSQTVGGPNQINVTWGTCEKF